MSKTIFQKIADREIPAEIFYEDEHCLVFRDNDPKAPTHVLVIPREPIPSVDALTDEHAQLLGRIWTVIPKVARDLGIAESGYRVVVNCGSHGGQTVDHLHYHILGGRQMQWPPG